MQCIRDGIPNINSMIKNLHQFLELVYDRTGKQSNRALYSFELPDFGWGGTLRTALETCKQALRHQLTLSHFDDTNRLFVYRNASDLFQSSIIKQLKHKDITKPYAEQRHDPLWFFSGRLNDTQLWWSMLEEEAFSITLTTDRFGSLQLRLDSICSLMVIFASSFWYAIDAFILKSNKFRKALLSAVGLGV